MDLKLIVEWNIFQDKSKQFVKDADSLLGKEKTIKTDDEISNVLKEIEQWENDCYDYLKTAFNEDRNTYTEGFRYAKATRFNTGRKLEQQEIIKNKFSDLREKKGTLEYFLKILGISDAIIRSNEIDLEKRAEYTMEESLELILEKLYELYDEKYYSISPILEGNGIVLKRYDDERDMVKILENRGLVKAIHTRTVTAQLTPMGRMYVEEKRKRQTTDYSKISDSQTEINKRIDEVIARLEKLGLGQEIIFDELSELKELYGKMDKKNWGQLLKGKIVDLGISQVINAETAKMVFEGITNEVLKLM